MEPTAGTSSSQQAEASIETEAEVHRQQARVSSGHYEEIPEPESPVEQATSGDDGEEATASEYAGLDTVAVAERRAQPPAVYEDLARR